MYNFSKKTWGTILIITSVTILAYVSNTVNAEEFTYYGCSATEANSGDFQTLDNCTFLTHTAWCSVNSGSINISYDECISLAYLYDETDGANWTYNSGWFTNTDVSLWQGAALYGDNFGVLLSGGHITDLQLLGNNLNGDIISGLNNLTYMTRLVLNFNTISSINLSNNTGLRNLYIGFNPISSIDVSANTALQMIYINASNISSIDVSTNTDLLQLWAAETAFTGVDLSHNPNIRSLQLGSTNVQDIDVSSYTGLEDLGLSNTSITGIDLSNNTALKYLQLNGDAGIQYLDLSTNTGLIELELHDMALTGINLTGLSVLRYLNVDNNPLEGLDISENPALIQLSAINTNLSHIDLSGNPLLGSASLSDNDFNELDISHNTNLYNLNASNNHILFLTVSGNNNVYDASGSFNLDYNALCDGTGDITGYNFLTTYAPTWNTTQYCPIQIAHVYQGNQSIMLNWELPRDYGFLSELSGYSISADFLSGATIISSDTPTSSYTFTGSPLINGQINMYTICALYSGGQITRCTPIRVAPHPATPYVLTETTPVAPVVTSSVARYSFYVSGVNDTAGETLVSDCGWGSDVLAEALVINSGMSIEIDHLQVGKTYECEVFVRSIPGMEESNHLHIGPFTVANAGGGGGGGSISKDICIDDNSASYYDKTCGDMVSGWKKFFAKFGSGAVSSVGNVITVKSFVTDVFTLLHITKPVHRQTDSDTKIVPEQLVMKIIQVLWKLLHK